MDDRPTTIAITGATGFVGRALADWLTARGFGLRAVTLPRAGTAADWSRVEQQCRGSQALIHLAARVHQMRDSPVAAADEYERSNVELTRQVLELSARAGIPRVVLASSVKAVGESNAGPWDESAVPHPRDAYGVSKLAAERLLAEQGPILGLTTVALRFPLIYGPGVKANMLRLFQAIDRGTVLPLSDTNRRSLLFVENAAAALELCATAPAATGVYFVRDGEDLSSAELARRIGQALGKPARLLPVPTTLLRVAGRLGDLMAPFIPSPITTTILDRLLASLQVDDSRLRQQLGYRPPFSVGQGLARTAAWYRARGSDA